MDRVQPPSRNKLRKRRAAMQNEISHAIDPNRFMFSDKE
jgi:hypothetical protein